MAAFVRVRNINPIGAVLTVLDGQALEVGKGDVVQVTPEQAGKAPHWRRVADGEVVGGHLETRQHAGHTEVRELGTGMLAQVTNWEAVTADKPTADKPTADKPTDAEPADESDAEPADDETAKETD